MDIEKNLDRNNIPQHIAIIMDGNGRWAKKQGENRLFGHHNGVKAVRQSLVACKDLGVKFLTIYTFSTENWNRPADEIEGILSLMVDTITSDIDELDQMQVRIKTIGELQSLNHEAKNKLEEACTRTQHNEAITLIIAFNYSSRQEITHAIKQIAQQVKENNLQIEDINYDIIDANLYTNEFPEPELLIRTSGEHRISNFLLWQIAYTELYFTDVLWPDFTKQNLFEAVKSYQKRERRFGKISEQLIEE